MWQDGAPSQADLEATLRDLLVRFRDNASHTADEIERFARAGAEALLVQLQHRPWLSSTESTASLGISEAAVRERLQQHELPSVRGADQQPRIHRRDVSLYKLSQRLGATEDLIAPRAAWSASNDQLGIDPWAELTPG